MASDELNFRPSSLNIVYNSKSCNILKTGIPNVHFKNWADTFECTPELFFAPKTHEEIAQILELARNDNKKVKVVGCKLSTSDIACTNGFMISLLNLNKIVQIDKPRKRVKVQAGMILSDLNDLLYSHNLALSVLGSTSNITVGGAISTGTHGTGIEFGTLSSYVTEIDLMLSNGSVMTISPEKDSELLQAAACSLGAFGIILAVTLQCEEAFNLQLRQYCLSLKDVIENLDVHISGSDHFKFMWYPYTDSVIVSHATRTDLPAVKESWFKRKWHLFWDFGLKYHTLELCYYISTYFPHFVPYINRFFYYLSSLKFTKKIDRSYRIFNSECHFKQYANEWAIPVAMTGVALWQLREWIESTPDVPVHFPVEVRFVKADSIYLSPAFGENTCYIKINMYRPYGKDIPFQQYWEAYECIMLKSGGRAHWAKTVSVAPETFRQVYPFFGKWCLVRQKLDPICMFVNAYVARILS